MQVETINTTKDFKKLQHTWEKLVENDPFAHIFQTWQWNYCHWIFSKNDTRKLLILVAKSNDKVVGIAPCYKKRMFCSLNFWVVEFIGTGDSDYMNIVALPDYRSIAAELFWKYLLETDKQWSVVNLRCLSHDSSILDFTPHKNTNVTVEEECPYIDLNDPEYFQSQSFKKKRIQYKRRLDRDFNVQYEILTGEIRLKEAIEYLYELHDQRMDYKGQKGVFQTDLRKKMFFAISKLFSKNSWLKIVTISIESKIAAILYIFQFKNCAYYYQGGFDSDYRSYSLGTITQDIAVTDAKSTGLQKFDFLRGNEPYKKRWAKRSQNIFQVLVFKQNIAKMIFASRQVFMKVLLKLDSKERLKSVKDILLGMEKNTSKDQKRNEP